MVILVVMHNGVEIYRGQFSGQLPARGDTISVPSEPAGIIGVVRGRSWGIGTSPLDPTEVVLTLGE